MTGAAKFCPGMPVPVEVLGELPRACASLPTVEDKVP
jgi:hypothetical protein